MLWASRTTRSIGTRPALEQALHLLRQRAPVGRDVQAAVVVQVERREAEFARQRRAVIVALARSIAGRSCTGRAAARAGGGRRSAGSPPAPMRSSTSGWPSRRNAIVMASGLPVAARWSPSTPFSAATIGFALACWRRSGSAPGRAAPAAVDAAAHDPRDAADGLVDQPGDAPRRAHRGRSRRGRGRARCARASPPPGRSGPPWRRRPGAQRHADRNFAAEDVEACALREWIVIVA